MAKVKGERREDRRGWERPVEVSAEPFHYCDCSEQERKPGPSTSLESLGKTPIHSTSPSASLLSERPESDPFPRTVGDNTTESMRTPGDVKSRENVTCDRVGGLDFTLRLSIVSILCRSEAPGALSLGPCRNRKRTQNFSKFAKQHGL